MNRKKRKAYKMFRRRYGKATNRFWQSRGLQSYSPPGAAAYDWIRERMRGLR